MGYSVGLTDPELPGLTTRIAVKPEGTAGPQSEVHGSEDHQGYRLNDIEYEGSD